MRRTLMVAALAAALSVPIASAAADSGVTVRGLDFPEHTYLTYFGCESLFDGGQAPQVRIGSKDADLGKRSFGVIVPGSGTASGPVHLTDSVATTTASFSARADEGTATGAAYVWYVSDELDEGQVWAGRATLSVGSSWTTVNTARASYSWQLLDAATGDVIDDGGTGSIARFTRAHGDGPGYMLGGFGCLGEDFSIDALRFGTKGAVTTYDLEGLTTAMSIDAQGPDKAKPGAEITITGSAKDGTGVVVGAPMVLQASTGNGPFKDVGKPVSAGNDGIVRKIVTPDETTTYRWYLPDLGYVGDSHSDSLTVEVLPPPGEEPTDPAPGSDPSPEADAGSSSASEGATGAPSLPPLPSDATSEDSSAEPSESPSEEPTSEPSAEATETPAPETTEPAPGEATEATP